MHRDLRRKAVAPPSALSLRSGWSPTQVNLRPSASAAWRPRASRAPPPPRRGAVVADETDCSWPGRRELEGRDAGRGRERSRDETGKDALQALSQFKACSPCARSSQTTKTKQKRRAHHSLAKAALPWLVACQACLRRAARFLAAVLTHSASVHAYVAAILCQQGEISTRRWRLVCQGLDWTET